MTHLNHHGLLQVSEFFKSTVKPVLSGHSKVHKTMVLNTDHGLMQVKSIAECSKGGILQYFSPALSLGAFCNTFDLH